MTKISTNARFIETPYTCRHLHPQHGRQHNHWCLGWLARKSCGRNGNSQIIEGGQTLDKKCMRRAILVLSGLVVILSAAALVRGAVGYPLMPWPVSLVILAISAGTFMVTMLRGGDEEEAEVSQKRPARARVLK